MSPVKTRLEGPTLAQSEVSDTAERLRFRPGRLPAGWLFVRNPARGCCTLRERPGFLRLWGTPATLRDLASPALVCRRQQHFDATARMSLRFEPVKPGEQAGLCLRANEDFNATLVVALGPRGRELRLDVTLRGETSTLARHGLGDGPVTLELRTTASEYRFSGGTGRPEELGRVPTRSFSAETILASTGRHHFTGAMIGLYATGAGARATVPADVEWFEYSP
jgi:alpha-N-arabinofuranosidase